MRPTDEDIQIVVKGGTPSTSDDSEDSRTILAEMTDPRGKKVVLKSCTWQEHILEYHPETDIALIRNTVEGPAYIVRDNQPEREEYYTLTIVPNLQQLLNFRVVVDHSTQPSEVVTAHVLRKLPRIKDTDVVWGWPNKHEG